MTTAPDPLLDEIDVEAALLRPLTDTERSFVPTLMVLVSRQLRQKRRNVDARIYAWQVNPQDPFGLDPSVAAGMLAAVIKRGLVNPKGLWSTSETDGDYSYSETYPGQRAGSDPGAPGDVQVTDADAAKLDATGVPRVRAVQLAPSRRYLCGVDDPYQLQDPLSAPQPVAPPAPEPVLPGYISKSELKELVMSYVPAAANVTTISGAVIPIASSATSVQLTAGRPHEITGSAAQTLTAPTTPTNGMTLSVKVVEAYTGSGVTMPTGMTQAGTLTAGQAYTWTYDGSAWLIS